MLYVFEKGKPFPVPKPSWLQGEGTILSLTVEEMSLIMYAANLSASEKRAWTDTLSYGICIHGTAAMLIFNLREAHWMFDAHVRAHSDASIAHDFAYSGHNALKMYLVEETTNILAARIRVVGLEQAVVEKMASIILLQLESSKEKIDKDFNYLLQHTPETLFKMSEKIYTLVR